MKSTAIVLTISLTALLFSSAALADTTVRPTHGPQIRQPVTPQSVPHPATNQSDSKPCYVCIAAVAGVILWANEHNTQELAVTPKEDKAEISYQWRF